MYVPITFHIRYINKTSNTSFIDSINPAVPVNNLYLYNTTIISPIENNTDPAIPQPTLRFTMQPIDVIKTINSI